MNSFDRTINKGFYSMQEDGKLRKPLETSREYREAEEELRQLTGKDNPVNEIVAVRRLCDLEALYFYRIGIQHGITLAGKDFPANGVA